MTWPAYIASGELDWQPHTVRDAIAGALKKKPSEKTEGRGRVYRIEA